MDRIVARKKTHNLKAGLYRSRKLRSARTKENNKPLHQIELLKQIIGHQCNDAILVVTTIKSKEQGESAAQQMVSPASLSSRDIISTIKTCCSPGRPRNHMLISPRKRVRFADDQQVVIVVSYKKSLSKEEKAQIWWTKSEMYEFRQKSKYFVKQDQQEQEEE
jgi:hypothetical protein